jgi:hypothetical protein
MSRALGEAHRRYKDSINASVIVPIAIIVAIYVSRSFLKMVESWHLLSRVSPLGCMKGLARQHPVKEHPPPGATKGVI